MNRTNKDLFSLRNKVVLITGGAGILGRHFCEGLAAHGASLAIVDIDGDSAQACAKKIQKRYRTKALGVQGDIASASSVQQIVKNVVRQFGKIDVLHSNAATKTKDLSAYFADLDHYTLKTWRDVSAVNIDAMFLMAQAVGKQMKTQKRGGSIIFTSSIYGIVAPDQRIYEGSHYLNRQINTPAVYSATKSAVLGLMRYLASYWAREGIRVNALTPGGVQSGQNTTFQKRYAARVPLARMAQASEMVGGLVYLASDASSYVTGHNLVIDGGLSAW